MTHENYRLTANEKRVLIGFSLFKLLVHFTMNFFLSYGIFRDEFYYLACAERLAAGFVDHPPLSVFILKFNTLLFGDSLFAIRLIPAIAGAATLFITGLLVKRFGGGTKAIVTASIAFMGSMVLSGMFNFFSMNAIDILLWSVAALLFMNIMEKSSSRSWIWLGVVVGLGLLNKIGMGFWAAGFAVGFLIYGKREELKTPWPWFSATTALVMFSPFVVWNLMNKLPHLEFIRNASEHKYAGLSPMTFLSGQIMMMGPLTVLIAIAGLYFLFSKKEFRAIGAAVVTVVAILLINGHSKAEYLSPAYPVLFAAGAVFIVNLLKRGFRRHIMTLYIVVLGFVSFIFTPFALPLLPPDAYVEFSRIMGAETNSDEGKDMGDLPQHFADRMGWENMAETVSIVYKSLSEEEQKRSVIVAGNYGEAASLEYYSRKYPLPDVLSTHNNYWLWGQEQFDKGYETFIILTKNRKHIEEQFEKVERKGLVNCIYAMPYETNLPVYVCRGLKYDLKELWHKGKNFE